MNFRKFYYRDYFNEVNLKKPDNSDRFKEIKKQNVPVLKAANKKLVDASLQPQDIRLLAHNLPSNQQWETIPVITTYPGLLTGSGYVHETLNEGEFKLGFYFDYTTGLPCIPGSSIKGVLRSVFPQFREKHPFKNTGSVSEMQQSKLDYISERMGWRNGKNKTEKVHWLEMAVFEGIDLAATKANKKKEVEYLSIYQRTCFYNAYISAAASGGTIFETDTITPHTDGPLKNPTPLNFLKIKPGVTFTIPIAIKPVEHLGVSAEDLKKLFSAIIKLAGIGAKTNVGYGQFKNV